MEQQFRNHYEHRGRGFFDRHQPNDDIEHAIYTGEITTEAEVLARMNLVRQEIQYHNPVLANVIFPVIERREMTNANRLESLKYSGEISSEYICPISNEIMDDPVSIPGSNHSFERSELHRWLNIKAVNPLNPGQAVTLDNIQTNDELRDQINEFITSILPPPPNRGCSIS